MAEKPKRTVVTTVEDDQPQDTGMEDRPATLTQAQEANDLRNFASMELKLRAYLESEGVDKQGFKATLYKYDRINHGKQCYVAESENSVLSAHEIGMQYGPGDYRYLLCPNDTEKKVRAWRFNIDRHYNRLRREAGLDDDGDGGPQNRMAGISESIGVLREVIELIRPMLPAASAPAPTADGGALIAQMKMFTEAMQQSMMDNLRFMRQVTFDTRRQALELPSPAGEEGGEVLQEQETILDTIERLWPMVEPIIKRLLGQGPASDAAAEMIKQNPEFRKIIGSAKKFSAFVQIMDDRLGQVAVDEALLKIGVHRPK